MDTAVLATLALSSSPILQSRQADAAPLAVGVVDAQAASFARPVEVSLLSGVDAIRWESENFTSAAAGARFADASYPGAAIGVSGATARLVGQNVGPLGVLPAGIQLMHQLSSRHITSPYGWRSNPTGAGTQIHIGQDYASGCGSPVYASASGVVVQSAWAGHSGMRVTSDHGFSVRTGYSHNSKLIAAVGQQVEQGQLIWLSGTTENSTGCHVHFEVIIIGRWNDPRNFLPTIPGQPNPMIDSRRATIAAEPIRTCGDPKTEGGTERRHQAKCRSEAQIDPEAHIWAFGIRRARDHCAGDTQASPAKTQGPETSPTPVPSPEPKDSARRRRRMCRPRTLNPDPGSRPRMPPVRDRAKAVEAARKPPAGPRRNRRSQQPHCAASRHRSRLPKTCAPLGPTPPPCPRGHRSSRISARFGSGQRPLCRGEILGN